MAVEAIVQDSLLNMFARRSFAKVHDQIHAKIHAAACRDLHFSGYLHRFETYLQFVKRSNVHRLC
jgi:hypothetical protein